MTCLVDSEPTVESQAQSALDSWNSACNGNLSVGSRSRFYVDPGHADDLPLQR